MTNPDAIKTIDALRQHELQKSAEEQGRHADNLAYAACHADAALAALERARNYSEALRVLDPEHAENYPDPAPVGPAAHPLVLALRGLADRYEALGSIPDLAIGATVEVSLHGVALSAARALAAAYADGAAVEEHDRGRHMWLTVREGEPELELKLRVHTDPDPDEPPADACCWQSKATGAPCESCTVEPFVQASPAEVAEAFELSAAYEASLTAQPRPDGWLLLDDEVHHTAATAGGLG